MVEEIPQFRGRYSCFSNFYEREVLYEGVMYPSSEHAFQAAKTLDAAGREKVRKQLTCRLAKKMGRALKLRPDWEDVKVQVMEDIVRDKFTRHEDLRAILLSTGEATLVEGNHWHDYTWGVCSCKRCPPGKNFLGKVLMKIRGELRGQSREGR
jgi:ribA/ribD-fused uncharacterized protein